ncbi:TetR/AcrR family transcriptional regulator [uncultured Amnibacterium sp.]|uniref:TetR/AcrR family transcriptional regulator n=1 Tax=uncultured Amnibacterium sp. TaxID=1631851 RepID=UPI0035CB6F4D
METTTTALPSPAPGTARARYANGERRREQLLAAAMEVFAEQGFGRTTLRAIAERAGTGHLSLIHHFGSKEVLYQRVLERRVELDRAARKAVGADADVASIARVMMRRNAAVPGIVHLDTVLTAEGIDPAHPAHRFIKDRQEDFVAEVTPALAAQQRDGRIRADVDPAIAAMQLLALISGIQALGLYDGELDVEHHVQEFLRLLEP